MKKTHINIITAFILGAALFVRIPLIGEIRLLEAMALICLPLTIAIVRETPNQIMKIFLIMLVIALIQIALDQILVNDNTRTLKFVSVYIFAILTTILLIREIKNDEQFIIFCMGACISALILTRADGETHALTSDTNYFKARYLSSLTYFVPIYFYYVQERFSRGMTRIFLEIAAIATVTYLLLVFDVRSFGMVVIISYLMAIAYKNLKVDSKIRNPLILIGTVVVGYISYIFYIFSINEFKLGGINAQTQLSTVTNEYNVGELLSVGRSSVYNAMDMALKNWFVGYGSYQGAQESIYDLTTHSIIIGNFLYGGIIQLSLAAVLYCTISLYWMQAIKMNRKNRFRVFFTTYFFLLFTWDYFFSPFGFLRLSLPPLIISIFALKREK